MLKRIWLRRRALYVLGLAIALASIPLSGLKWYLSSATFAQQLSRQLSRGFGSSVYLVAASTDLIGQTRLHGLTLLESQGDEWLLQVDRLTADVSAWSVAMHGIQPRHIAIQTARLRLRFDENGQLLTHLPQPQGEGLLPEMTIRDAEVILEQRGRPPFRLSGIALHLDGQGRLNGRLEDAIWGAFDLAGHLETRQLSLQLASDQAQVQLPMLRALPFVPVEVWQTVEFHAAGVPLRFTLTLGDRAPHVQYRLDFARVVARLPQPDRPALVVRRASGVLQGNETGFRCTGLLEDDYWGTWKAQVAQANNEVAIELQTAQADVDAKKLRLLPYVPLFVWDQIQVEGKTSARVNVRLATDRPEVRYRVECHPQAAQVHIAAIDLTVQQASGQVIIADHRVRLQSVQGQTGNGSIVASGDLDFRSLPTQLRFQVAVKGVQLRQLPRRWELPAQIDGRLSGSANLTVRVGDHIETSGAGKGQIDEASLVGFRTREPIGLTLLVERGRFRFLPRIPPLQKTSAEPVRSQQFPTEQIAQLTRGVTHSVALLSQAVETASQATLAGFSQLERLLSGQETTVLEAEVVLDEVDLDELIRRADLDLPYRVAGQLSLRVRLGIPINSPGDLRNYRLRGRVRGRDLRIAGLALERLRAVVWLERGVLYLDDLETRLAQPDTGRLTGSATLQLAPLGLLEGQLRLEQLSLPAFLAQRASVSGQLHGKVNLRVPLNRLNEPPSWQGYAHLASPALTLAGISLLDGVVQAGLSGGQLHVRDLRGQLLGGWLTGTAQLDLAGPLPYRAQLQLRGGDLSLLGSTTGVPVAGGFHLDVGLQGNWGQWVVNQPVSTGRLTARRIHCAGVPLENLAIDWSLFPHRVVLDRIRARAGRGTIDGIGELASQQPARGQVQLLVAGMDLAQVLRDAPSLGRQLGEPKALRPLLSALHGRLAGQVRANIARQGGQWQVASRLVCSAPEMSVAGMRFRRVDGQLTLENGRADYRLLGELYGGRLTIQGRYPPPPRRAVDQSDATIRVERVQIGRLARSLGLTPTGSMPLRGVLDANLSMRHDGPDLQPIAVGRFELRDVRYQGTELSDNIRGDIRVNTSRLFVRDANGSLAGGQIRFNGAYHFVDPARTWFNLRVEQASAAQLPMLGDGDSPLLRGRADLILRGQGRNPWRATGELNLARGSWQGVAISELRAPLEVSFQPDSGAGELTLREFAMQIGQGRARGQMRLRLADVWQLQGHVQLLEASLSSLAGLLGDVSSFARGRVSGRIDFSSANLRGWNDVSARVAATLQSAQALQFPVLQNLTPFLLPGRGGLEFTSGQLRGQLANGNFRVQQLSLESPLLLLLVQGTITLQGRLDLEAMGRTSLGTGDSLLLGLLFKQIPAVGPIPVGVLIRASQLLAERLVRVRISGTVRTPVVRIEPVGLLDADTLRFFVNPAASGRR